MRIYIVFFLLLSVLLSGCMTGSSRAQGKAAEQRRTFVPEVSLSGCSRAEHPVFLDLKCKSFRALPPFDAKTFLFRRKDGEFASDFYRGWLLSPQDLIAVQTVRYLEASGLFRTVLPMRCSARAGVGVEGVVTELFVDVSGERPEAVVALRLLFTDERSATLDILYTAEKRARVAVDVDEKDPNAVSRAFNEALTQTLAALTADLAKAPLKEIK